MTTLVGEGCMVEKNSVGNGARPRDVRVPMMRRGLVLLLAAGVLSTGCVGKASEGRAAAAATPGTEAGAGGVKEFVYQNVRLAIPADWPVRNEDAPCPAFDETGLFVVQPVTDLLRGSPSCNSSGQVADGVRIGPLVGYPPTPDGVAPIIGGEQLAKVDLDGGVAYRTSRGPDPHSFWLLLPKPGVQLLFTYASDIKTAETIASSVSMRS